MLDHRHQQFLDQVLLTVFGFTLISWEALIVGFMTLAIPILSEVIPKTIGANNWENLYAFDGSAIKVLLFLLAPLIWITQSITRNLKRENKPVLSRTDFSVMTDLGKETGVLKENEQKDYTKPYYMFQQSVG